VGKVYSQVSGQSEVEVQLLLSLFLLHYQKYFPFFLETGSHYVAQAGLELSV
jgi:hypothetical protein